MARAAVAAAAAAAALAAPALGAGAFMRLPPARQVVQDGAFLSPRQLGTLDAGGREIEQSRGHSVCGGTNSAVGVPGPNNLLETSEWGPTAPQVQYVEGADIAIEMVVDDHQFGWFEFRLCRPSDGGVSDEIPTTQGCLNEHVLKFTAATRSIHTNDMRTGLSSPADMVGNFGVDPDHAATLCSTVTAANSPRGSCCNQGGTCSSEPNNEERWVLPKPNTEGPNGASLYRMIYQLPAGVTCDRCVLQAFYSAGDNPSGYPSGVWNCADIAIAAAPVEEQDQTAAIAGAVVAGLLIICAALYVRSSIQGNSPAGFAQRQRQNSDPSKSSWFGNFFDNGGGRGGGGGGPGYNAGSSTTASSIQIGQPVIVGHNTVMPKSPKGPAIPMGGVINEMAKPPRSAFISPPSEHRSPPGSEASISSGYAQRSQYAQPPVMPKPPMGMGNVPPPPPPFGGEGPPQIPQSRRPRHQHDSLDV